MSEEKWKRGAQAVFDQLVKRLGGRCAADTIGPAFGQIYYHQGYCMFDQGDYKGAAKAFQISYEKYPNSIKRKEGQRAATPTT